MSFLQPWVLWALPLMALPILIHLIHRHRHRSVSWGAMMFLVRAQRMNKGMARLRYVTIMLLRMLAIGLLVFAVSRPLATGRLGAVGLSRPDATVVLLDRSASMETQDLQTGESRRSTALRKLAGLLEQRGFGNQLVLIDSATGEPLELEAPGDLLDVPQIAPTATSADIPALLEAALALLAANEAGRADVWICSDLAENDWAADSGRWASLRQAFGEREGVQVNLLSYAGGGADNLAVRVEDVRRHQSADKAELVLDLQLLAKDQGVDAAGAARVVPVEFEIGGLRSVLEVTLEGGGAELEGHRIEIDSDLRSGFGVVRIPGDANLLDNSFYFAFGEPPVRRAVIVTEDAAVGAAFRRALAIASEPGAEHSVAVCEPGGAAEFLSAEAEGIGLVVWHAPLPRGASAVELEQLVAEGRVVLFVPPEDDGEGRGAAAFGFRWGAWQPLTGDTRILDTWRGDEDLLAHAQSGRALPLDELRAYRVRALQGQAVEGAVLARLKNGAPLLVRAPTDHGAVYFAATLPTASYSTLERDAIAFYVMLQRALARGSAALANAAQSDAGEEALPARAADEAAWEVLAPLQGETPSASQRGLLAGVYQSGERLAAVNRSADEDGSPPLPRDAVGELFAGLSFQQIDDEVGDESSLASEVWRAFLLVMVLALIGEAILCLPRKETAA